MHCRYCGINHEARDFIRAILLHLIDQFEISQGLIEFLSSQKLITTEAYEQYQKVAERQQEEEETLQWFKKLGTEQRRVIDKILLLKPREIDEMIELKNIMDHEGITDHLDNAKDVVNIDFKKMVELLLKQRPEISAEQMREMIDEKKRKVGAGYLTDQGALFLIGADLGISFENVPKLSSGIKDLYIGAKEVTITARVMNIYPVRRFIKKDTNEEIVNRTMTVYDKESSIKVRLWDNNQINIPDEMGLQPGDLIKISGCYVTSDPDGEPIISLGSNGSIELVDKNDNG
jgi:hypothetical protein